MSAYTIVIGWKNIYYGQPQVRGIRLCEPCAYMSGILHSDVLKKMVHRAALRAQIIEGGIIKVSDDVSGLQPDLERDAFFDADS